MLPSWFMVIKMPGNGSNEIVVDLTLQCNAGRKHDRSSIMEQRPEGSADYCFLFGVLNYQQDSMGGFYHNRVYPTDVCSFGNYS